VRLFYARRFDRYAHRQSRNYFGAGALNIVFLGFIIGALATPSDPNFVANGSHGSPGDGFLVMGLAALGFFASVPESIVLTRKVLRRPRSAESESDQLN
jgi:hypothetical protein